MSKKSMSLLFHDAIGLIIFKVAHNKEMHRSLDVFKFWPDWTTYNRVSCPWASKIHHIPPNNEENCVSTFHFLFTYLKTIRNILMTLLAGSQVSDRCLLGYLFYFVFQFMNLIEKRVLSQFRAHDLNFLYCCISGLITVV